MMACRIEACADRGVPAVDHLVVKWFLTKIYPRLEPNACKGKSAKQLHPKFISIIDAMIQDRLIKVVRSPAFPELRDPRSPFRLLELAPNVVPSVWFFPLRFACLNKHKNQHEMP
eukprot:Gregarina_sp_Poly_1__1636@NODE_1417_length_4193_cov_22_636452_g944_i0_p3_GENE_NODE_1417_length_4193_cov_22_636452_g944_i0NODE_1417_length_4193_cov_22_636452_g944_i0_p3_ORF_typecomplete_len115_score14_11_NODE_1417_length_4193_cov_22_636452_g944_i038254169